MWGGWAWCAYVWSGNVHMHMEARAQCPLQYLVLLHWGGEGCTCRSMCVKVTEQLEDWVSHWAKNSWVGEAGELQGLVSAPHACPEGTFPTAVQLADTFTSTCSNKATHLIASRILQPRKTEDSTTQNNFLVTWLHHEFYEWQHCVRTSKVGHALQKCVFSQFWKKL